MTELRRPLVLVVEDEPKIARLLLDYLGRANYATHWIDNGLDVARWARQHRPDLVLLDLMLPGKDGLDVCSELRRHGNVPIIMITARVEEIDRLLGLELGADDYLCKPFSLREAVARVKSVLRRAAPAPAAAMNVAGIDLNEESFTASAAGRPLDLTPVEFRLLSCLLNNPARVFSRAQLIERVYPDNRVVSDRTMDTHVKNLRKKLCAVLPQDPVRSVYGVGYKLEQGRTD